MEDVLELLRLEGQEIDFAFKKASLEGKGTPQEISDHREAVLTRFLEKFFPFPYRIAKGSIRDSYGNSSMSIDCILLNPAHPYTISNDKKFSIILADGTDLAIELKPDLNTKTELIRSLKQITSVKTLQRKKGEGFSVLFNYTDTYKKNLKRIPGIIFSNKTYKDEKQLIQVVVNFYNDNQISRDKQFDLIVVNNRFLVLNNKKDYYLYHSAFSEGIIILDFKKNTLAAFLFYLNRLPQSESRMSSTVLEHYINTKFDDARTYSNYNKTLLQIKCG